MSAYDNWKLDHPDNYCDNDPVESNIELYDAHYLEVVLEHLELYGEILAGHLQGFIDEARNRTIEELQND